MFFSTALNYLWMKLVFLGIIIFMLAFQNRTRKAIFLTLLSVAFANPLTDFFKHAFPMHRPFQPQELGHLVILRVGYASSMGTASGHSANMSAVAVMMTFCLGAWGYPWIAIALITGFSRIYCGAHYPWQVALGYTCGITVSTVLYYFTQKYIPILRIEKISSPNPEISVPAT